MRRSAGSLVLAGLVALSASPVAASPLTTPTVFLADTNGGFETFDLDTLISAYTGTPNDVFRVFTDGDGNLASNDWGYSVYGDFTGGGLVSVWVTPFGTDLSAPGAGTLSLSFTDWSLWSWNYDGGLSPLSGSTSSSTSNARVPEPATLSLLALGLAGVLAGRRFRSQARDQR